MQTMRALLLRDFRRFGPFAAGWFLFYFFQSVIAQQSWFPESLKPLLIAVVWMSWLFLIAMIIHDARPVGSDEFWMTRPVSGTQLFLEKLAVVILFCVLAPGIMLALAQSLGFEGNGWLWSRGVKAKELSVWGHLFSVLNIALVSMLLATLTRNKIQYVMALFLSPLLMGLALLPFGRIGKFAPVDRSGLFSVVMTALTVGGFLFLIHRQYALRNRKKTILSCLAFILIALIFMGALK